MAPNPSLTDISQEKSIKEQGYLGFEVSLEQKGQKGRSFSKKSVVH